MRIVALSILAAAGCAGLLPASAAAETVDFAREIRPILSDKCFQCHGPDLQRGGLRFDEAQAALAHGAIVPGAPNASALMARITAAEPEDRMPPPRSNLSLSAEEIGRLRAWIAAGAAFERHWAFEPIPRAQVSEAEDPAGWARNPIDAFVLHGLEAANLIPSPEADPEALLRRVALDLTGLPPTLAEMNAYLAEDAEGRYEAAVERLLASSAYGERMALDWLDVARYADTHGYQDDKENEAWPWRDWLIRAFNANLPYDDFVRQQLAGDLLEDPTQDQMLATAFNRIHRQTNEGGVVEEEFLVEYAADRTHTAGMAFLGLTMECARCHDHKYDPISQREYYEFFAFFNNIDESGMYSHFTDYTPTPNLFLYEAEQSETHKRLRRHIVDAEQVLDEARMTSCGTGALAGLSPHPTPLPEGEGASGAHPTPLPEGEGEDDAGDKGLAPLADGICPPAPIAVLPLDRIDGKTTPNTAPEAQPAKLSGKFALVEGPDGQALAFDGENSVELVEGPLFERYDPFSVAFWVRAPERKGMVVLCHQSKATLDAASCGWEIFLDDGHVVVGLAHFWPGNAVRVRSAEPLVADTWTHLAVAYDGSSRADGIALYLDGAAAETEVIRDNLYGSILYERANVQPQVMLGARFRDPGLKGGALAGVRIYDVRLTAGEVGLLSASGPHPTPLPEGEGASGPHPTPLPEGEGANGPHPAALSAGEGANGALTRAGDKGLAPLADAIVEDYIDRVDAEVAEARAKLHAARKAEQDFVAGLRQVMVMRELPEEAHAYLLDRGAYDARSERLKPATPAAILPFPEDYPRNRLGLAEWLLHRQNPLTARVAVNRYWQLFFGRGLVETPEDFGSQGAPPSHPELLDYLAAWFIDSGWDVKALCRLISTSATYRQESTPTTDRYQRDPENRLLARGPRHRLEAERIRDAALAASGLLVRAIGGPSVKPYQPEGLWEDASKVGYTRDDGEALYRRSMYTFWKRTVHPPSMATFDAGNREVCVARREVTATPLQSLVLLNDLQFVEAARVLGSELTARHAEPKARLVEAFRRLIGRHPSEAQLIVLQGLYEEQRDYFDETAARAYLGVGEWKQHEDIDPVEAAATTAVVQALLCLDEFQVNA